MIDNIELGDPSVTKLKYAIANNNKVSNTNTTVNKKLISQKSKITTYPNKVKSQNKKNKVITYKVRHGDTLYSISKKFNVDISDVRSDNKLAGNDIQLNQVLKIK